jgi:YVTN family beta-propeller protein
MIGNNLYLATRTTISSQSLTSAPHLLTSNGSVAVAGQKIETALTTSTGLQQTISSFDRLFTASSMFLTFRKADARLVGFPYSLISASRFPQFETRLHIGADKVASDSLGNMWIADSSQLKIEKISRYFQITSLRNELTNHPETPANWDTQDRLYIPLRNLNAVAIVNASTGAVDIEGVCQSPRKSVIDTSQTPAKLFTICPEGDLLSVITLDVNGDFSSQAFVGVGKFPIAMELIPDTVNRLFIANKNSDSVSILNSTSNAVVSTLTVQDSPIDFALNTATNTIELAHEGSAVITHIASAGTTTSTTLGSSGFSKISVNPTSSQIFALSRSRSSVASSPSLAITSSDTNLIGGEMAYSIVSESTLSKTYVTHPDADVVRIIAEAGTQTDVAVGSRPVFVLPYATASKVFVSNYDDDTVSIIGLATNSVSATATLTSGCGPTESRVMTVGASTYLYVLCQKNDSVEIINTSTNAVGTPISLRFSE